jgi:acetyl-CoA acetyltransferase
VAPFGLFTAAEFGMTARSHMEKYGTTEEQIANVSAVIRNNGHVNPEAVFFQRGPYTVEDILASRMIADPFHLLDCSMTSEGGCGLVIVSGRVAAMLDREPVYLLGSGADYLGPEYQFPPSLDYVGRPGTPPAGLVGARAADRAFAQARLGRQDVDVLELYEPFSFEVIRQLEAFGFCPVGEGGRFAQDGHIGPGGSTPVTTDGGLLSYGHAGAHVQILQRTIRGVQQLRGEAATMQVPGAHVALFSIGGVGALYTAVGILGDRTVAAEVA